MRPFKKQPEDLTRRFRETTGLNLHEFWNVITGFDLIKFDRDIGTPDEVSCKDHILARFGSEAVTVVEELIQA